MSDPSRPARSLQPAAQGQPSHEELTAALEQERAANRRLREAARRQAEYVSTASHELRTPLAAIIGFVKTLRQPGFAEDAEVREELLARSERQGARLMRMLEQLLASSVLEHRAGSAVEPFDLRALIAEIAESFPDGEIDVDVPPDLPPLRGDRDAVGVIMANLIGNAIRFSPQTRRCRVGARSEAASLRLWVEDDGIGMTPDELAHAFEPFYQGAEDPSEGGGVGLGLYVVRRLVDTLEGDVAAHSAPGLGTRVEVVLPQPMGAPAGGPRGVPRAAG